LAFSIIDAKHIPYPGLSNEVLNRRILVSIVDKGRILSNVHTIAVPIHVSDIQSWRCVTISTAMFFPRDDPQASFIHMNKFGPDTSLLFELVTTVKTKDSGSNISLG
jgi:hypothetical protein